MCVFPNEQMERYAGLEEAICYTVPTIICPTATYWNCLINVNLDGAHWKMIFLST